MFGNGAKLPDLHLNWQAIADANIQLTNLVLLLLPLDTTHSTTSYHLLAIMDRVVTKPWEDGHLKGTLQESTRRLKSNRDSLLLAFPSDPKFPQSLHQGDRAVLENYPPAAHRHLSAPIRQNTAE